MICKDSDAFALEKYLDSLLEFNLWKNTFELADDLKRNYGRIYTDVIDSKFNSLNSDKSDKYYNLDVANFLDTAMKKLCFLFPMKYEYCEFDSHLHRDIRYKRKLGFT